MIGRAFPACAGGAALAKRIHLAAGPDLLLQAGNDACFS